MGELRVVEVLSSRRPVAPHVSSAETAAASILTPLNNKGQDDVYVTLNMKQQASLYGPFTPLRCKLLKRY